MTDPETLKAHLPDSIAARVESATVKDGTATLVLDVAGLDAARRDGLERAVREIIGGLDGIGEVRVAMMADRAAPEEPAPLPPILAIGSGKGGVGKSTLTANLAVALTRAGRKVGLVDADVYGPSQPKLFACEGERPQAKEDKLIPIVGAHGVPLLSMGHLVESGQALAWRGPMAGNAVAQLIDAHWGEAQLLLVDLPPGTGDVQLTMMQKHKPAGALIVSTPQDLALIDAQRAAQMFAAGEVPLVGLVENMAGYECPHCGEVSDPFGRGGVEAVSAEHDIPFLGRIPLHPAIREASDAGRPPAGGDDAQGRAFAAIAMRLTGWLDTVVSG